MLRLLITISSALLGTVVPSEAATLLSPKILERVVTDEKDPLRTLKNLRRSGVRGPVFRTEGLDDFHDGIFLVTEDWSGVRAREDDSATWWQDAELLAMIKNLTAAGTTIVIQNRTPVGGFVSAPGDDFSKEIQDVLPDLAARSFVVLNGFSNLYTLKHEMVHHLDNESGRAEEIADRITNLFDDPVLTQDQLTHLVFYILEARAYHLQNIGLLANRRPIEYYASIDGSEHTVVTPVDGADFRRYRFARDITNFNRLHVANYQSVPIEMRTRIEHLLPIYIPNYPRDFTVGGELHQGRCEKNLLADLAEGRTICARTK